MHSDEVMHHNYVIGTVCLVVTSSFMVLNWFCQNNKRDKWRKDIVPEIEPRTNACPVLQPQTEPQVLHHDLTPETPVDPIESGSCNI